MPTAQCETDPTRFTPVNRDGVYVHKDTKEPYVKRACSKGAAEFYPVQANRSPQRK